MNFSLKINFELSLQNTLRQVMDQVLIIIALLLSVAGILGSILPGIPGPPLNFIALLVLQWAIEPFRLRTLIIWTIITLIVVVMDYLLPLWTAKKFGATKSGIIGSVIGMVAGMFFTPLGMIAGLIIGSIIGDLIAQRTLTQATSAATGNFLGTFLSMGIKLICAGWMTLLVVYKTIQFAAS